MALCSSGLGVGLFAKVDEEKAIMNANAVCDENKL